MKFNDGNGGFNFDRFREFPLPEKDVVEGRAFILRDEAGQRRAILTADADGSVFLAMFDHVEQPHLGLMVDSNGQPSIALFSNSVVILQVQNDLAKIQVIDPHRSSGKLQAGGDDQEEHGLVVQDKDSGKFAIVNAAGVLAPKLAAFDQKTKTATMVFPSGVSETVTVEPDKSED